MKTIALIIAALALLACGGPEHATIEEACEALEACFDLEDCEGMLHLDRTTPYCFDIIVVTPCDEMSDVWDLCQ